jgi:hypothetical protein
LWLDESSPDLLDRAPDAELCFAAALLWVTLPALLLLVAATASDMLN